MLVEGNVIVLIAVGVITTTGLLVIVSVVFASVSVVGTALPWNPEGKTTGAPEVAPSNPSTAFVATPVFPGIKLMGYSF